MKEVAVIVPTYKRDIHMLSQCINSIITQTLNYSRYEIIVVDDNGGNSEFRKDTQKYIEKIKENKSYVNIKLVLNESNQGGAISRNIGVQHSKAEYVTFLDDDDEYLERKLENQLEFMKKHNYDMIFSNIILKKDKKIIDYREYSWLETFDNNYLLKNHLLRHITGTPTFMYKREVFIALKGFPNVKMGQEFHLMLNTIKNQLNIGYLNKYDVVANIHDGERISNGKNKISGEKRLFDTKLRYKNILNDRDIKFIKMRHYAVLASVYLRDNSYLYFLKMALKSFMSSPYLFIKECITVVKKRRITINE